MNRDEQEQENLEQNIFQLLGKEIRQVKYIESPPLDDLIGWAQHKEKFHGVQQGLQLTYPALSGMQDAYLHWNGSFFQYGLGFAEKPWTDFVVNGAVWDVSSQKPWSKFLPAIITSVSIYWHSTGAVDPPLGWPRPLYPRDLELTFANQFKIYCSAAHMDTDKNVLEFAAHNVIVAWTDGFAEEHKICSYSDSAKISSRELDSAGRIG
ncbi:MAG: hypothetical protein K2X77_22415 [Candidatus Obscuribacterales bacterium]|nr:hypothetical protein [Candidatus Obscuribacterales bacterium]